MYLFLLFITIFGFYLLRSSVTERVHSWLNQSIKKRQKSKRRENDINCFSKRTVRRKIGDKMAVKNNPLYFVFTVLFLVVAVVFFFPLSVFPFLLNFVSYVCLCFFVCLFFSFVPYARSPRQHQHSWLSSPPCSLYSSAAPCIIFSSWFRAPAFQGCPMLPLIACVIVAPLARAG